MKKIILLVTVVLFGQSGYSQTITETQKLETLCKVWGFLKYYHPIVTAGKLDWDKELFEKTDQVKKATTKQELNQLYMNWIKDLGPVKPRKKELAPGKHDLPGNAAITWMNDTTLLTAELLNSLEFIRKNRTGKQYYVNYSFEPAYDKEKPYKDAVFPNEGMRLLGLFRFWNVINYFYPFKETMQNNWNNVLAEMIPRFALSADTTSYHLSMMELVADIGDSHNTFHTPYTDKYFGLKWVPVNYKLIDGKAVIHELYDTSLCRLNDLRLGDLILKVNNKTVAEIINENAKYIGASNQPARLRNMNRCILNGSTDSVKLAIDRNGTMVTKYVKRYVSKQMHETPKKKVVCKSLSEDIGYINLENIKRSKIDSVMAIMKQKKAMILDLRNYPQGFSWDRVTIHLNNEIKPVNRAIVPDLETPGVMRLYGTSTTPVKLKTDYYKGKVIVLVNEETQSFAELFCMALQTAPDVNVIGSQTAGAFANCSTVTFPGNYSTWISGLGVTYPDGTPTQRIGIVPDIEVKPTIKGIQEGRDEVLERAIKYINEGK